MREAMGYLSEMFSYPFMVRAFITGTMIALCASLLGAILVLKRYSMIGDGLSHVGFGALAVAKVLSLPPLAVCIPVVGISSVFLLRIKNSSRIKGDAATALISTGAIAMGVMMISISTGMNTDVCNYLFGSILSMTHADVWISSAVTVIVVVCFILFYRRIFSVTFDPSFARATGTNVELYNTMIAFLTSLVIVIGMRMIGALLISSLIVIPSLSAMRTAVNFFQVIIRSLIISVLCVWIGLFVSYAFAFPTGASIVTCDIAVFIVMSIWAKLKVKLLKPAERKTDVKSVNAA